MSDPADPARTGVVAGRVVGVLTASIVVLSLLSVQHDFVGRIETVVGLAGIDTRGSVSAYFWLYVAGAAIGRYALCYVVGSLIGVTYDALEEPSVPVVVLGVLAIGLVDGFVAYVDTRNLVIAGAYPLAWLCYVPAFYHYLGVTESQWGKTRRLGGE
jgi:hypothetical protein